MTKPTIAVFASGTGSNYHAVYKAIQKKELTCDLALLVSDQPTSKVIEKAKEHNTPYFAFQPKEYSSKDAFESEILDQLRIHKVDWIILAGYMRLIGPTLLQAYEGKILNIHPSLLPSFPGLDAIGQAFKAGVKITGVTIHYVDEGMDTGEIIAQEAVKVLKDMDEQSLQKKIQLVEHQLYPTIIQEVITQSID
ncbi:Phosphoribosylglycinamide formyltransferase [Paraliobacillus sp. PM-2]|uniref:phosphoribosylglycinamide formyltransferase n=1 Tax=Paraliobacillus sp. PM-2 TaxID=1462524 RepID=UPI00061BAA63|nr:phosphoribosylglycinamide formyltransferase [Paraliobacillus sp. PM-2]CQR47350.1 Phosphoribosylglycinamide formyltransferase [Paraliobacillus sp. PM-2]